MPIQIEKASDVIVKIGAAEFAERFHIIEGVWKHIQDPDGTFSMCMGMKMRMGRGVVKILRLKKVTQYFHPLISGTVDLFD
ncbi:MAG: hypothetical protein CM1200mP13_02740 [Candidatus Pelagibacterales bacterium]|nr:MAG: hypothetical protein CM1200mP13_02740 [Pelagibacterales bacterium]